MGLPHRVCVFAMLLLGGAIAVGAQTPVLWSAHAAVKSAKAGGVVPVALTAQIDPGWHIYSLAQPKGGPFAMHITVPGDQPFTLVDHIDAPAPRVEFDRNFNMQVETYTGTTKFSVPLKVAPSAQAGVQTARIAARFQVCNASLCLPPQTVTLDVPVPIVGKSVRHTSPANK